MFRPRPFSCKQGLIVLGAVLALLALFVAFAAPRPASAAAPAQRIVSLAPAVTEMCFALGLGDRVVGVTRYCNYPTEAQRKPKVGDVHVAEERVIALRPTLILAAEGDAAGLERLGRLTGAKTAMLTTRRVADVWTHMRAIGRLTGTERRAEAEVKKLQARLEAKRARAAKRPSVFYMVWDQPLMTAGAESYLGDLITLAGGRNIVPAGPGGAYPAYSAEALLAARPEVLLGPAHLASALKNLAGRYPALATAKVRTLPDDLISRPGPRVVQALEAVERALK